MAGVRAKKLLMQPASGHAFKAWDEVRRLDFAVALVRAAGLESVAQQRSGAVLGVGDEADIPTELRGFVSVALEQKLIATIPSAAGPLFNPNGTLGRIDAALFLLDLLDLRSGSPIPSLRVAKPPPGPGGKGLSLPSGSPKPKDSVLHK